MSNTLFHGHYADKILLFEGQQEGTASMDIKVSYMFSILEWGNPLSLHRFIMLNLLNLVNNCIFIVQWNFKTNGIK